MSKQNTEINDEPRAKSESSAVDTVPIQKTADIFKLDIDCFQAAFDYLPIKDLVSVGKTS